MARAADMGGKALILKELLTMRLYCPPYPPALPAPIIFCLDNKRMADADAQEYGCAYDDSVYINTHFLYYVFHRTKFGRTDGIF